MKTGEAQDLIAMITAATAGAGLDAGKQAFWEEQLVRLEAEQATQAVLLGIRTWKFFPSWADFMTIYAELGKLSEREEERKKRVVELATRRPVKDLPFWVKRWVCARMLYKRFGKDRDDRHFAEMGEFADPTSELMPADEWSAEAETITDVEAWRAVVGEVT